VSKLHQLVRDARVIVCVGSGGVGKTTSSALLGLHAALQGRRVLVMTVDPARRLANALGLRSLDDDVQRIDLAPFGESAASEGGLWATMLDMKTAFDELVERHTADDPARKKAILGNRFYQYFSTSLAGAQELSASERLYEVFSSGEYDLIVLDTPPTSNALDFLDAPFRFFDALDSAAFGWLTGGAGLLNVGAQVVLRTLGRFTGRDFFDELSRFLIDFSALFDGFKDRARATTELFAAATTHFVIVTSPDPMTVDEALYFRSRLSELKVRLGALIVNRVRQPFSDNRFVHATPGMVADALHAIEGAAVYGRPTLEELSRKLIVNAHEFDRLAERDATVLDEVRARVAPSIVVSAPLYANDVHSLDALDRMRRDLMGEPRPVPQQNEPDVKGPRDAREPLSADARSHP